jgi:hypothetical protein
MAPMINAKASNRKRRKHMRNFNMPIQDAFHGVLFLALRFAFQPLPQRRGAIFIGHRVQDEGYDPHPCVPRRSRGLTACALLFHACLRFFRRVNLKSNSFAPSGVHVAPPNLNRIYRNAHAEPFAPGSSTPHKSSPDSPGPRKTRHFARSR